MSAIDTALAAAQTAAAKQAPIAKIAKIAIATGSTQANEQAAEWSDPLPLVAQVKQDPYPVDALLPIFRAAIVEVQSFIQAPVCMVAMSAVGAASAAVQALVDVQRAEGLKGPVGLSLLALAVSGERKTTIDGRFAEPICAHELDAAKKGEPAVADYEADFAAWEAEKRGIILRIEKASKSGKSSDEDKQKLRDLNKDEPKPPRIFQSMYTDATPEALAHGLATRWPSALIQSSEAGLVFGAHAMGKESIMRTLALYNTLWDGGAYRIDRRAIGNSYWVKHARLTLSLQVQPDALLEYLNNDHGLSRGTGFLARFLIACPQSTQGTRQFREPPKSWPALARFNKRTSELLSEQVVLDEDGGIVPVTLILTPEAKAAWIQFHDRIESELKIGGSLCDVRDVASKTADNACRLAAIFQIYEYGKGAVGLPAFESGARLAEWHLTEARRFFGEVVMPEENALATKLESWLVEYCQRRGVSSVPISTIQNSGPSKLRPKVALETTIRALEELGRVRRAKGQGKAQIVEINPALLATAIFANPAIIAQYTNKAVV